MDDLTSVVKSLARTNKYLVDCLIKAERDLRASEMSSERMRQRGDDYFKKCDELKADNEKLLKIIGLKKK